MYKINLVTLILLLCLFRGIAQTNLSNALDKLKQYHLISDWEKQQFIKQYPTWQKMSRQPTEDMSQRGNARKDQQLWKS